MSSEADVGGPGRPPRPSRGDPYLVLADDAAHQEAVAERLAERERRDRASEVATWLGTLRDLAERRVQVALSCAAGRSHRGRLVAVGVDHVGVQTPAGSLVLVALDTIRSVRPAAATPGSVAMGDRDPRSDRRLIDVLDELVQRDGDVAVALREVAEPLHGRVLGIGDDVLSLQLDAGQRERVYLPLSAIAELLIP